MIDNNFNKNQYSQFADQYLESNIEGTIGGGTIEQRIALLQKYLPAGRKIFEIGSGGGDDALALKEAGYDVLASDFVESFVQLLTKKGLQAINFDAKNDKLNTNVDALYANAVFVHFTPKETQGFLMSVKAQLKHERAIFLSLLKGEGQERSARGRGFERDFYYYTESSITELLNKIGYNVVKYYEPNEKWLQVIARV